MFDELTCEHSLPGNPPKDQVYQTKSLRCHLDLYNIAADGVLWRQAYDRVEETPGPDERSWPYPNIIRINKRWVKAGQPPHDGTIFFYGGGSDYTAAFDGEGKLLSVKPGGT